MIKYQIISGQFIHGFALLDRMKIIGLVYLSIVTLGVYAVCTLGSIVETGKQKKPKLPLTVILNFRQ